MKTRNWIGTAAISTLAILVGACASTTPEQRVGTEPQVAILWTQSCSHCHNLRPAPEYTAAQWSIIVKHMRTQANLTRSEATSLAEYLGTLRERSSRSP